MEQSFLWKLVFLNHTNNSPGGQTGEFFIDRTNRVRTASPRAWGLGPSSVTLNP